jgi:hypothetical protein
MSAKIKLNAASGGGSFSLQAPSSSANNRVMTLPDTADGTILTTTNLDGVGFKSVAILQEESNADLGTFTKDAYRTRTLNVEVADPDNIVTLSSNQFTLGTGTYIIEFSCPAFEVDHHHARLAHISGTGGTSEEGSSEYSDDGDEMSNRSLGIAFQTITGSNVYEIQHRSTQTQAGNGFGVVAVGGNTIGTIVKITKIL